MKTAYSYQRFSSPEQSHGDSLRRQTKRATDLCQEYGWHLDDTLKLRDLGVSAYRGKNVREGALAAFLEAIKLGKVKKGSVLIVESLDRLSRDEIDEALTLFLSIIRAGVDIATFDPKRIYDRQSIKNPLTVSLSIRTKGASLPISSWTKRRGGYSISKVQSAEAASTAKLVGAIFATRETSFMAAVSAAATRMRPTRMAMQGASAASSTAQRPASRNATQD